MKIKGKKTAFAVLTAASLILTAGCSEKKEFNMSSEIHTVSREDGSGTRGAFTDIFKITIKGADGSKKDLTTKEALVVNKTDVMLINISGDRYAIGYISLGSLNTSVKALKIDGVNASEENIRNGAYALSRPFNIVIQEDTAPLALDFIEFILSKEGQAIAANEYVAVDYNSAPYSGNRPSGKIVVSGSSSVTPIVEKLGEAYEKTNPGATVEIQMSDSTAGVTGVLSGTCDIGLSSRWLTEEEKSQLTEISIATDGIVIVVNNENPIESLTKDQVRKIFIGETIRWAEVE